MESHEKPELQEYATQIQIEFFDRLRSGDDPVHEEARTELVKLAEKTLELLGDLRVGKADHDAEVRGILTKLKIIAGDAVEVFTLDIVTDGYDISDADLMNDLKDEAKARFNDDEKLVLALLAEPEVALEEVDNDYGCVGHHLYSFSTFDAVTAEKYGFTGEAEREAEAQAAREAAAKREAEFAAQREATVVLIKERGLQGAYEESYQALVRQKGEAAAQAIRSAVEHVAKGDPEKQIDLFRRAVTA
jgi:pyruvate/2-oxoglutarate dehydrogenase complex dihydrolipoamide acyltransferase (E2) component